jgi:hypothetical protein
MKIPLIYTKNSPGEYRSLVFRVLGEYSTFKLQDFIIIRKKKINYLEINKFFFLVFKKNLFKIQLYKKSVSIENMTNKKF